MVNKYRRKTSRASVPEATVLEAVNRVLLYGEKVRAVGKRYGIPHVSLGRYVEKQRQLNLTIESASLPIAPKKLIGYSKHRSVFNEEQESALAEYLLKTSEMYFGLTPGDLKN
jgi:hypothetical protein